VIISTEASVCTEGDLAERVDETDGWPLFRREDRLSSGELWAGVVMAPGPITVDKGDEPAFSLVDRRGGGEIFVETGVPADSFRLL